MPEDLTDRFPPEPVFDGAVSLVRNGLFQTDCDAAGYRILNLDASNLVIPGIPSQSAPPHEWFNSYDVGTHLFGSAQPAFTDLIGNLSITQQRNINRVGRVFEGIWEASTIDGRFLPTLDDIAGPTGPLAMLNQRITGLGEPVQEQDAVTLRMFNTIASGLHPKGAVRCATTGNNTLIGLFPVDGVALADNDRVLVKDQSVRPFQNGIYLAHPGSWTRTDDLDVIAEFETASCFVLEGSTNANSTWFQINPTAVDFWITVPPPGVHNYPDFRLLSRSAVDSIVTGDGLDRIGNTIFAVGTANRITISTGIDIASNYVGQGSITTIGTIANGAWQGDIITSEFGGTGVNNQGFNVILLAGDFTIQKNTLAIPESSLTFSLIGTTTLTLPQLGTVATLNGIEVFTNKSISADQITSGIFPIVRGGTGGNSQKAAMTNLLPSQTGHPGESLHTDGTGTLYWA